MDDRNSQDKSRRSFLTKSALTSFTVFGMGTQTVSGSELGTIHYAEAGVEHEINFSSLPSHKYKTPAQIREEALARADLSWEDAKSMSQEEVDQRCPFPGDPSQMVNPALSSAHIDRPRPTIQRSGRRLYVDQNSIGQNRIDSSSLVINNFSSSNLESPGDNLITDTLAGFSRPNKVYHLASTSNYTEPNLEVETTGRQESINVQAENASERIETGQSEMIEHTSREIELELKTYDLSSTVESVEVIPKTKIKNHGEVPVTARGDYR